MTAFSLMDAVKNSAAAKRKARGPLATKKKRRSDQSIVPPGQRSVGSDGASAAAAGADSSPDAHLPPKPPGPLNAYNFFFKYQRMALLHTGANSSDEDGNAEKTPDAATKPPPPTPQEYYHTANPHQKDKVDKKNRMHRKTHGKFGFTELAKIISARWRAISDEQRSFFKGLASNDLKRWRKERDAYDEVVKRVEAEVAKARQQQLVAPGGDSLALGAGAAAATAPPQPSSLESDEKSALSWATAAAHYQQETQKKVHRGAKKHRSSNEKKKAPSPTESVSACSTPSVYADGWRTPPLSAQSGGGTQQPRALFANGQHQHPIWQQQQHAQQQSGDINERALLHSHHQSNSNGQFHHEDYRQQQQQEQRALEIYRQRALNLERHATMAAAAARHAAAHQASSSFSRYQNAGLNGHHHYRNDPPASSSAHRDDRHDEQAFPAFASLPGVGTSESSAQRSSHTTASSSRQTSGVPSSLRRSAEASSSAAAAWQDHGGSGNNGGAADLTPARAFQNAAQFDNEDINFLKSFRWEEGMD